MELQNNPLCLLFQNFMQHFVKKFWIIIIVRKEEKIHIWVWLSSKTYILDFVKCCLSYITVPTLHVSILQTLSTQSFTVKHTQLWGGSKQDSVALVNPKLLRIIWSSHDPTVPWARGASVPLQRPSWSVFMRVWKILHKPSFLHLICFALSHCCFGNGV